MQGLIDAAFANAWDVLTVQRIPASRLIAQPALATLTQGRRLDIEIGDGRNVMPQVMAVQRSLARVIIIHTFPSAAAVFFRDAEARACNIRHDHRLAHLPKLGCWSLGCWICLLGIRWGHVLS